MPASLPPGFGKYDSSGRIRILERPGEVVVCSRYARGALVHVGLTLLIIPALLVHTWWSQLRRGSSWDWEQSVTLGVGGGMGIVLALWAMGYFYRKDELVLSAGVCSYSSWVPWQAVEARCFQRGDMIRLTIGQSDYVYRLQLEVADQNLGIYSHARLSRVRETAERLKALLGLPLEEPRT
jgi:hypothetical protein